MADKGLELERRRLRAKSKVKISVGMQDDVAANRSLSVFFENSFCPAGREMCLYSDPAYPLRILLQAPFRVGVLTRQMEISNEKMSAVRTSVEWLFADIINYFKFLDFKKNLRIGLSQVGKMYIVCAILRNALTCLYSNTTAEYFGVDPPTLQDYFANSKFTA